MYGTRSGSFERMKGHINMRFSFTKISSFQGESTFFAITPVIISAMKAKVKA
jgi:hypothetical protein